MFIVNLKSLTQRQAIWIFSICALALTFFVYLPGFNSPFLFDDHANITENTKLHIDSLAPTQLYRAANAFPGDLFKRPISMLSLGLDYYFYGLNPTYFKITNTLLHLFMGFSIGIFCYLLLTALNESSKTDLDQQWRIKFSILVAALWLLHPINLSSVLYAVQRMTILSSLFVMWGLIAYTWSRLQMMRGNDGIVSPILGVGLFGLLAFNSKENGALLPLYLFILELCLLRWTCDSLKQRRFLIGFFACVLVIPILACLLFLAFNPLWLTHSYSTREFTMVERLLTEARVLWIYLKMIFIPQLADFALYHDDIPISKSLFSPLTTVFSIVGVIALGLAALILRKRVPILSFTVLFFLAAHSMESSILSVEIAHEHRNYLPSVAVLMLLTYVLLYPKKNPNLNTLGFAALIGFMLLFAATTTNRAQLWSDPLAHAKLEVSTHPNSARSQYRMAHVFAALSDLDVANKAAHIQSANSHFLRSAQLDPYHSSNAYLAILRLAINTQSPFETQHFEQLLHALATYPLPPTAVGNLVNLIDCQAKQDCAFPPAYLQKLIVTALNNTATNSRAKAQIHASQSNLAFLNDDIKTAMDHALQAVTLDPTHLQHQLNLNALNIKSGKFEQATMDLARIRKKDRYAEFTSQIVNQESVLNDIMKNRE